jgi:hypothetical protein
MIICLEKIWTPFAVTIFTDLPFKTLKGLISQSVDERAANPIVRVSRISIAPGPLSLLRWSVDLFSIKVLTAHLRKRRESTGKRHLSSSLSSSSAQLIEIQPRIKL